MGHKHEAAEIGRYAASTRAGGHEEWKQGSLSGQVDGGAERQIGGKIRDGHKDTGGGVWQTGR